MGRHYILNEKKEAIPCDMETWAKMFGEFAARVVMKTNIDKVLISTMFLGMDYSFTDVGDPSIFESMIFGGQFDQSQRRYSTWDQAISGHWEYIGMVIEDTMKKVGIQTSVTEKGIAEVKYYVIGHGHNKDYHHRLMELYEKMYNVVHLRLVDDPADHKKYEVVVSGTYKDLELAIERLSNLALLYPYDKWLQEHKRRKNDS